MPSADGPQGPNDHRSKESLTPSQSMELQLFESLVHHLLEKGVLTRNNALSVVQTVAEVRRGHLEAGPRPSGSVYKELATLGRLYASFELVTERPLNLRVVDGDNVLQLRPPIHGDNPQFPKDD